MIKIDIFLNLIIFNLGHPNAEFSKRDSMSSATHGAFAYVPWPFASAAMPGSRSILLSRLQ